MGWVAQPGFAPTLIRSLQALSKFQKVIDKKNELMIFQPL
jgi:hypothetical protein